jgi:hypothetical protein
MEYHIYKSFVQLDTLRSIASDFEFTEIVTRSTRA